MAELAFEGGCLCGSIRYTARGDSPITIHCHCLHCRGVSGAPFMTWAEFAREGFEFLQGEPRDFSPRPGVTRRFCGDCGTPLTYESEDWPEEIDVAVCTLDDPNLAQPRAHIWTVRRLEWLKFDDGLPSYPKKRGSS